MKLINLKICLISTALLSITSCTKLDTKPFNAIGNDLLYADSKIVQDAQSLVNTALVGFGNSEHTRYANSSSGELINPYDGQSDRSPLYMKRAYQHAWTANENRLSFLWNTMYGGLSKANVVLSELDALKNKPSNLANIKAAVRVARAFFLFHAMDNFRNIALDTVLYADPFSIKTNPATETFNYIERELKQCIPLMDENVNPKGRFNKYVAYTLLAQLYLNAQVYTGTPRWADASAACDMVINSGKYTLAANYFDNFAATNSLAENILVSYRDRLRGRGNTFIAETVNSAGGPAIGLKGGPWNSFVANADLYDLYDANDMRKRMWLVGPQRAALPGENLINGVANTGEIIKVGQRKSTLNYTVAVPRWGPLIIGNPTLLPDIQLMAGVRNVKYYPRQITNDADKPVVENNDLENDYVIMRYADVLLMKAECELRLNNPVGAASPFNLVRARAFGNNTFNILSPTLDDIRDERSREFAWESYARRDNIRFEVANPAVKYWSKARPPLKPDADTDNHWMIFPIPNNVRALNPRLVQNPGYQP